MKLRGHTSKSSPEAVSRYAPSPDPPPALPTDGVSGSPLAKGRPLRPEGAKSSSPAAAVAARGVAAERVRPRTRAAASSRLASGSGAGFCLHQSIMVIEIIKGGGQVILENPTRKDRHILLLHVLHACYSSALPVSGSMKWR